MNKVKLTTVLIVSVLLLVTLPVFAQVLSDSPVSPHNQIIKTSDWLFETNQVADTSVYDHREMMVSSGCDVNGDGYEDVLVGDRD